MASGHSHGGHACTGHGHGGGGVRSRARELTPDEEAALGAHSDGGFLQGEKGENARQQAGRFFTHSSRRKLRTALYAICGVLALAWLFSPNLDPCQWSARGEARQELLFELLVDAEEVLREHANTSFFLLYGTAIGAFRIDDILPWTHDADVVLQPDVFPGDLFFEADSNEGKSFIPSKLNLEMKRRGLHVMAGCKRGKVMCGVCRYSHGSLLGDIFIQPFWAILNGLLTLVSQQEYESHVGFYSVWTSGKKGKAKISSDRCYYPFEFFAPWQFASQPSWETKERGNRGPKAPRVKDVRGREFAVAMQTEKMLAAHFGKDWLTPQVYASLGNPEECLSGDMDESST